MVSDKQFVFIIGAPRSGSTWLHSMLASHPEVASTKVELSVFTRYVNIMAENFEAEQKPIEQGKWEQGLPYLWSRTDFDKRMQWFINEVYSSLKILPEHKVILDKHPAYSFNTKSIYHYLPQAKFIHIIRDGRDVAYSWYQTFYKIGFGNGDFGGACADWIHFKEAARNAQKLSADNYIEIRYENLLKDTKDELTKIFTFCGLKNTQELLDKLVSKHSGETSMVSSPDPAIKYEDRKSGKPVWKKRLSKEQLYFAKRIMGKDLIKEGYEKDLNWGINGLEYAFFFIKLKIRSFFRVLGQIRKIFLHK